MQKRASIDQRIAALEAKAAKLRAQKRAAETRQKIILGAALLGAIKREPSLAEKLTPRLLAAASDRDRPMIAEALGTLGIKTGPTGPDHQTEK